MIHFLTFSTHSFTYIDRTRFRLEHEHRLKVLEIRKKNPKYQEVEYEKDLLYRRIGKSWFDIIENLNKFIKLLIKEQKFTSGLYFAFFFQTIYLLRFTLIAGYHSFSSPPSTQNRKKKESEDDDDENYLNQNIVALFNSTFNSPYSETSQPQVFSIVMIAILGPCLICRYEYLMNMLNWCWMNETTYIKMNSHILNFTFLSEMNISAKYVFLMIFLSTFYPKLLDNYVDDEDETDDECKSIYYNNTDYDGSISESSLMEFDESDMPRPACTNIKDYALMAPIDRYYYYNQFDYGPQMNQWADHIDHQLESKYTDRIYKFVYFVLAEFGRLSSYQEKDKIRYLPQPGHRCSPRTLALLFKFTIFTGVTHWIVFFIYLVSTHLIKLHALGYERDTTAPFLRTFIDSFSFIFTRTDKRIAFLQLLDHLMILYYFVTHMIEVDSILISNIINLGRIDEVVKGSEKVLAKCEYLREQNYIDSQKLNFVHLLTANNSTNYIDAKNTPVNLLSIKEGKNENSFVVLPLSLTNHFSNKQSPRSYPRESTILEINTKLKILIEWISTCIIELSDLKEQHTSIINLTSIASVFGIAYISSCLIRNNSASFTIPELCILFGIIFSFSKSIISIFYFSIQVEKKVSCPCKH